MQHAYEKFKQLVKQYGETRVMDVTRECLEDPQSRRLMLENTRLGVVIEQMQLAAKANFEHWSRARDDSIKVERLKKQLKRAADLLSLAPVDPKAAANLEWVDQKAQLVLEIRNEETNANH